MTTKTSGQVIREVKIIQLFTEDGYTLKRRLSWGSNNGIVELYFVKDGEPFPAGFSVRIGSCLFVEEDEEEDIE